MNTTQNIDAIFESQIKNTAPTTLEDRIDYLSSIEQWVELNRASIIEAHYSDLHKPESETELAEIWYVLSEIKLAKNNLRKWMRSKRMGASTLALLTAQSWIHYEPRGVVLIIAPWNFPFNLTVGPLISAIAAGNRVIIKPSEMTPNVSKLINRMINELFEPNRVAIFEGDHKVAQSLLKYPFHHIFFVGSPSIGKIVMAEAAKHLSSITLELGGKTPTIIDETANIQMAVNKLAWGKCLNLGQSCISPDYILIHESKKSEFIEALSKKINDVYGESFEEKKKSNHLARIVNQRHWDRLDSLITSSTDRGANIVHGGGRDRDNLFIEPTILDSVTLEMNIMNEEIFGPLLPVLDFKFLDDCIKIINQKDKPLALYMFSESKTNIKQVINNTSSGGMVINEVKTHFLNLNLPFGGVNKSGMGRCHGYSGFLAFSNLRAMQKNGKLSMVGLTFPPYTKWTKKVIKLVARYF
tara:strand:- start:3496 stop:4902 length:1407 start_codon:yes stop_codon:yes gene_type:complete